jgi:hypothetical protein
LPGDSIVAFTGACRVELAEMVDIEDVKASAPIYSPLLQRQSAGLEGVRAFREEILRERNGEPLDSDVVETINQMREERGKRNRPILTGSGD